MVWLRHSIPNKLIPSLWWTAYFLMEKSLVWYLVFLSFKINSVVLNVCWYFRHSLFHLDRQIFQSLGLRSKRSAKFPDLIVIWSLVPLFIWGVFILLSWLIFVLFTNIFTKILLITTFLAMHSREIFLWIDQFLYQLRVFNVFNFFSFWINWRQVLSNVKMNRVKNVAIFSEIIWTWLWNSATILKIVRKIRCKNFRSSEVTVSNKLKKRCHFGPHSIY